MRMRHWLLALLLLTIVTSIGCGRRFAAYRYPPPCCPPATAMIAPTAVPACPPPCCP